MHHNLPTMQSTFVGRADDIAHIVTQLQQPECRLLTIVGPGGIGKTRLSLEVGAALVDDFADGATFVDLTSIVDAAQVPAAMATALNMLAGEGEDSTIRRVCNYLWHQQRLLIIDKNFPPNYPKM